MPLAKKRVIAKPVRTLAVAIRNTPAPAYADRGALSANSGRKYPKNAAKTKVFWESFRAWNTYRMETLLPRVPIAQVHRLAFVSSLPLHTTRKRPILLVTDATPALQKSL